MGGAIRKERITDYAGAKARAHSLLKDMRDMSASRCQFSDEQLHYFKHCSDLMGGAPLLDAVKLYLDRKSRGVSLMSVSEVFDLFLASRENRSPRYYQSLKWSLTPFVECVRMNVAEVQPGQIDHFLSTIPNARTRHNIKVSIGTMFSWARKKGHLPFGEAHAVERAEEIVVPTSAPGILSPGDLEKILRTAELSRPDLVAWIALGAFAGLRSSERDRLRWEDINWSENAVPLSSDITKTSRRRVIEMGPSLRAWMDTYRQESGRICPLHNSATPMSAVALAAGVDVPHNALRHSFVTYDMLLHSDSRRTAEITGHSVDVLQSRYKAVAFKSAAVEWFSITPTPTPKDDA